MRIRPLLDLLRSQGDISGYAVVDRDMSVSGDVAEHYDVVLAHRIPSSRQIAWLRRTSPRFAYDIDDLLLPAPGERLRGQRAIDAGSVAWCLANACCVSAPSQRLLATLETRLRAGFGERSRLILERRRRGAAAGEKICQAAPAMDFERGAAGERRHPVGLQRHRCGAARHRYRHRPGRPFRAGRARSVQPQRVRTLASSGTVSEAACRRTVRRGAAPADGPFARDANVHRLQVRHPGRRIWLQSHRGGLLGGPALHRVRFAVLHRADQQRRRLAKIDSRARGKISARRQ